MSLDTAMQIADLRAEHEELARQVAVVTNRIRDEIRKDVMRQFSDTLKEKGFSVLATERAVICSYKGLSVKLEFDNQEYIGIFDSFVITHSGRAIEVNIKPVIKGAERLNESHQGDPVNVLQNQINAYRQSLNSMELQSYSFLVMAKGKSKTTANSVSILIDSIFDD